ncbi:hypothetical protein OVA21_13675 [Dietzia sp. SL131]|uniref:hypothetical protein n=1 Tax=Dietzia sp. SL131 TaxID=2995149 RepID=UPI002279FA04|nr:hypothetical protein [Dietzia sp. SL131]MCY1658235.1 hypothetical protein [Dietzia sp. SL131]
MTNALGMAIESRLGNGTDSGTIIHSDHGVQFGAWAFTKPQFTDEVAGAVAGMVVGRDRMEGV